MKAESDDFDPQDCIAAVLRGETDQYRALVREYGLLVRGFLATRLFHHEDVEDLAQEVFVIAFDKLDTFATGSDFRGWLIGIAKLELKNHWRKNERRATAMERFRLEIAAKIEPELESEHAALKASQIERLLDCIARLPERARRIVRAGLDGVRAESVAEELGMTVNSLYQARFRAHAALRKCMESAEPVAGD